MANASPIHVSADRTIPTVHEGKIPANYYCRGWSAKRKKYCKSRAGLRTAHPGVGRCWRHGGHKLAGDHRIKGGGRSMLPSERVKELVEQHLADPKLFDVSRTLATAKALADEYIERYEEITPALLAWYGATEPLSDAHRLALLACLDELEALLTEPTPTQTEQLAAARAAVAHLATERVDKPRQVPDLSEAVRHADVISKIIHRVNLHHAQSAISYARLSVFMFALRQELDVLVEDRPLLKKIVERVLAIRI